MMLSCCRCLQLLSSRRGLAVEGYEARVVVDVEEELEEHAKVGRGTEEDASNPDASRGPKLKWSCARTGVWPVTPGPGFRSQLGLSRFNFEPRDGYLHENQHSHARHQA